MRSAVVWMIGAFALPAAAGADEAILPDGQRMTGELRLQGDGRLYFASLRLDRVQAIRFAGAPGPALPNRPSQRIHLHNGQSLTGEILGLNGQRLQLRTAWATDPVTLPRPTVRGLTRPGGILPDVSPDQDAVTSNDGDELFGEIVAAARDSIEIKGPFGSRRFRWDDVRGASFHFESGAPRASDGAHVQVWFGPENDRLDGVVIALDDRRLTLRHPDLGIIALDRRQLRRLQWQFFGQRWEAGVQHHLGGDRLLPLQAIPLERLNLKQVFALQAVPAKAHLAIQVANLPGPGDGTDIAKAQSRGGLQTQVLLNGRPIDHLNRHGERSSPRPRWLSLDLPVELLRAGDNVVELRQLPDAATGRYSTCDVFGFRVDLPRD